MERLLKLLKEYPEIKDYKVVNKKEHSYQLFYVSTKLETNRISDKETIDVTIYINVEDKRGSATFAYASYQEDKEVKQNIEEAIFNASLSLNPFYEIPGKQDQPKKIVSNMSNMAFDDLAEEVSNAVFSNKMDEHIYSAATEIFLNKEEIHVFNSKGLNNQEVRYFGEIELIPTCDTKEKEVEVYQMMRFSDFSFEAICNEVKENLKVAEDRYNAIDLPKNVRNIPVIIDCDEIGKVFQYFVSDLEFGTKHTKNNLYELNESIQGKDVVGSKLNLSLISSYPGASNSRSFDNDGITLKNIELIKEGIAVARHGGPIFAYYLKTNPTGVFPIIKVEPGNVSFKEMQNKPYLRCVRFSNLQMERACGLIGGEVRLAYYFDGEKEIPVTGFTFTGNMHELRSSLLLSKETKTYSNYVGPRYVLFDKVNIL